MRLTFMRVKRSSAFNISSIQREQREIHPRWFNLQVNTNGFAFILRFFMKFIFRAHHPSAYFRFAILLFALIVINLIVIAFIFPQLKNANDVAIKSIVLIVPWLLLLLL